MDTIEHTPKIQPSNALIGALADAFGKSLITVQRWVIKKDIMLTTEVAKQVFAEFGLEWVDGELRAAQTDSANK